MSTNFYVKGDWDEWERESEKHVGKRYAAGLYCWDCHASTPEKPVYFGGYKQTGHEDTCPKCGQTAVKEAIGVSSAGRELGFNKSKPMRKTGVASASGFIWAMQPEALEGVELIEDEYGTEYTRGEFMQMLEECPIQDFTGRL